MKQHCLFLGIVLVSLVVTQAWGNAGDVLPSISFERTVCDLGQVGLGIKSACEFKFTNTGQATLEVTNVRRTLGVPRSLPTFQAGTVRPAHAKLRHAMLSKAKHPPTN
jgi:hypothetical protein